LRRSKAPADLKGWVASLEQSGHIEPIILPKIRPVLGCGGGDFDTNHLLWQKLNKEETIRSRLRERLSWNARCKTRRIVSGWHSLWIWPCRNVFWLA
jgi:hypothetical protein